MRLVTFRDGGIHTGLVAGDEIIDLTDPLVGLPGDMVALLELGSDALDTAAGATATGAAAESDPLPWLRAGDTVTVSIEGIGELTNPVVDEADPGRMG